MSVYYCSQGHASTESDYCSECGIKIDGLPQQVISTSSTSSLIKCPACGAEHDFEIGNFCEICGYNFTTGAHGELPIIESVENREWEITIAIAPTSHHPDSPKPPINQAPISLRLTKDSYLIGRRNEARGIYPDIELNFDEAVSRRHALLNIQPDGTLTVRDIDSANGTRLNDIDLKPMVDVTLKDGDKITLGHWTYIILKASP